MAEQQTRPAPAKLWSASVGPYGFTIRVFEVANGIIYGECRDPARPGKYITKSLRHRDKKRALKWAKEQSAKWQAGVAEVAAPAVPTAARVFALYLQNRSPRKVATERQADRRRVRCWTRWLGANKDLSKLALHEWEGFIDARRTGAINAEGEPVPPGKPAPNEAPRPVRKPVRDRTIWADLVFLLSVLNWACKWRDNGEYLLKENVIRGDDFALPKEKNTLRPVVTPERFESIRAVAEQVTMRVGRGEDRRELPSYLPELLDLAWHTGRRISAILALRYCDLRLPATRHCPHGAIIWPADTDKIKVEWTAPLNAKARAAIDRVLAARPGIGAGFLFPHPNCPGIPLSKDLATAWHQRAEDLAGVGHLKGGAWHPYRRGWATARKHLPLADVAAAGGWADHSVLATAYMRPDPETLQEVVDEPIRARQG